MKNRMPSELSDLFKYGVPPGAARMIGDVLRKRIGVETTTGYKLTKIKDSHKNTIAWSLLKKPKDGQQQW